MRPVESQALSTIFFLKNQINLRGMRVFPVKHDLSQKNSWCADPLGKIKLVKIKLKPIELLVDFIICVKLVVFKCK